MFLKFVLILMHLQTALKLCSLLNLGCCIMMDQRFREILRIFVMDSMDIIFLTFYLVYFRNTKVSAAAKNIISWFFKVAGCQRMLR